MVWYNSASACTFHSNWCFATFDRVRGSRSIHIVTAVWLQPHDPEVRIRWRDSRIDTWYPSLVFRALKFRVHIEIKENKKSREEKLATIRTSDTEDKEMYADQHCLRLRLLILIEIEGMDLESELES